MWRKFEETICTSNMICTKRRLSRCLSVALILVIILILADFSSLFRREWGTRVSQTAAQCKWPPSEVENLLNLKHNYDISICVRLSSNASIGNPKKRYLGHEILNVKPTNITLRFEELPYLPKRILSRVRYPDIYKTYPQDVPLREIVEQIKSGSPVSYKPDYNFPIQIVLTSQSVCRKGSQYDLVIVVKSGLLQFEDRQAFRTYIHEEMARVSELRVGCVFSLGFPRRLGGRIFDRDGVKMVLAGPAGDKMDSFKNRQTEVLKRIRLEARTYDDIVLGDYEDTYFNLTWKSVTNYRWMSAFCRKENVKLFLLIDDDHRVNLSMVAQFMQRVSEDKRNRSGYGFVARYDEAERSTVRKLFLSYREFPWERMHRYLHGFAQLVGPDVVDDVAIASAYTKYNYAPEDVYIGLVMYRLGIEVYDEVTMFSHESFENNNPKKLVPMIFHARYLNHT